MAARKPTVEDVEDVIDAVQKEALQLGHPFTPRGRKLLRRELQTELGTPEDAEKVERGEGSVQEAAREFMQYAQENELFRTRTRVGVVVIQYVVQKLRAHHEATSVCIVWPFC